MKESFLVLIGKWDKFLPGFFAPQLLLNEDLTVPIKAFNLYHRLVSHLTGHFEIVQFVLYHRHAFLEGGLEDEAEDALGAVGDLVQVQKKPGDTGYNGNVSHQSAHRFSFVC